MPDGRYLFPVFADEKSKASDEKSVKRKIALKKTDRTNKIKAIKRAIKKIYHSLRTTGSQPIMPYGLAEVQKLYAASDCSGSSNKKLNRFLSPFFQKLPGANIETTNLEKD